MEWWKLGALTTSLAASEYNFRVRYKMNTLIEVGSAWVQVWMRGVFIQVGCCTPQVTSAITRATHPLPWTSITQQMPSTSPCLQLSAAHTSPTALLTIPGILLRHLWGSIEAQITSPNCHGLHLWVRKHKHSSHWTAPFTLNHLWQLSHDKWNLWECPRWFWVWFRK